MASFGSSKLDHCSCTTKIEHARSHFSLEVPLMRTKYFPWIRERRIIFFFVNDEKRSDGCRQLQLRAQNVVSQSAKSYLLHSCWLNNHVKGLFGTKSKEPCRQGTVSTWRTKCVQSSRKRVLLEKRLIFSMECRPDWRWANQKGRTSVEKQTASAR